MKSIKDYIKEDLFSDVKSPNILKGYIGQSLGVHSNLIITKINKNECTLETETVGWCGLQDRDTMGKILELMAHGISKFKIITHKGANIFISYYNLIERSPKSILEITTDTGDLCITAKKRIQNLIINSPGRPVSLKPGRHEDDLYIRNTQIDAAIIQIVDYGYLQNLHIASNSKLKCEQLNIKTSGFDTKHELYDKFLDIFKNDDSKYTLNSLLGSATKTVPIIRVYCETLNDQLIFSKSDISNKSDLFGRQPFSYKKIGRWYCYYQDLGNPSFKDRI